MLRVTMEIVPYGQEDRKRTIGTMEIANITAGFSPWDDRGDYQATLITDNIPQKSVKFFNWPRKKGCWALLQALLQLIHKPIPLDYQSARYLDERPPDVSVSFSCHCPERAKPAKERNWVVIQRRCNHSAFNGYRYTPSDYSTVWCNECHALGRTKAAYVDDLRDGTIQFDQQRNENEVSND